MSARIPTAADGPREWVEPGGIDGGARNGGGEGPPRASSRGSALRWPLRWKLFAAFVALSLVTLLAGGVVGARLLDRASARATAHFTEAEALRLAAALGQAWESPAGPSGTASRLAFARQLIAAVDLAGDTTVLLVAPNGQVLFATERSHPMTASKVRLLLHWEASGAAPGTGQILVGRSTVVLAAQPVISGGLLRAVVVVGRSVRQERAAAALVSAMLLRAGGGAVALSLLLAIFMAERIAVPLRAVAAAAGNLSHGDLSERVTAGGRDELGALADAFNEMAERLQAAVRGRQELVAAVSHELRTPLTSLQGFVQGLRDGVIPPGEVSRTYQVIDTELARVRRLIDDLFELSRWEAGRLALAPQLVAASELVQSAVEYGQILAGAHGPAVRAAEPLDAGQLTVDPDRVFQVLSNLVQNAVRFTAPSGHVTLRAVGTPDIVRFEVEDTGSGIPARDLPRVFERFHTVEPSRARPTSGTGLGLAIAAEIVRAHGGRIGVRSAVGQGTLFWCEFPRLRSTGLTFPPRPKPGDGTAR